MKLPTEWPRRERLKVKKGRRFVGGVGGVRLAAFRVSPRFLIGRARVFHALASSIPWRSNVAASVARLALFHAILLPPPSRFTTLVSLDVIRARWGRAEASVAEE